MPRTNKTMYKGGPGLDWKGQRTRYLQARAQMESIAPEPRVVTFNQHTPHMETPILCTVETLFVSSGSDGLHIVTMPTISGLVCGHRLLQLITLFVVTVTDVSPQ